MRIPGLAGRVYRELGVDARLIAPGEIFPNLERGVIDAAELSGRFSTANSACRRSPSTTTRPAGTRWRPRPRSSSTRRSGKACRPDLKAIVENACAACNVISEAWCQKNNAEAMEDLIKNQGIIAQPLPDDVVKALRVANDKILAEAVAKDPVTKKVHNSYMAYKAKYDEWADLSEIVYHTKIRKA